MEIRESKVKTQSRQQESKCRGASEINLHTLIFLSTEQQKDAGTNGIMLSFHRSQIYYRSILFTCMMYHLG